MKHAADTLGRAVCRQPFGVGDTIVKVYDSNDEVIPAALEEVDCSVCYDLLMDSEDEIDEDEEEDEDE